jgi:hypothetical protein
MRPARTVTPDTLTLRPDSSSAPPLSRVPRSSSPIGLGLSPGSPSFPRPRPPSSTSFYWALYAPLPPRRKSGYMPTGSPYHSATPLLPGVYSRTPERSPESSPQSTTLTPPRRPPWSRQPVLHVYAPRPLVRSCFLSFILEERGRRRPSL